MELVFKNNRIVRCLKCHTGPFCTGYSSFPDWSTLGKIREFELERGNEFPDVSSMDPSWPAKWVAESKIVAYSYAVLAQDAERVLRGELAAGERDEMENTVCEIPIRDGDILLTGDGEGGYLVVRPNPNFVTTATGCARHRGLQALL